MLKLYSLCFVYTTEEQISQFTKQTALHRLMPLVSNCSKLLNIQWSYKSTYTCMQEQHEYDFNGALQNYHVYNLILKIFRKCLQHTKWRNVPDIWGNNLHINKNQLSFHSQLFSLAYKYFWREIIKPMYRIFVILRSVMWKLDIFS